MAYFKCIGTNGGGVALPTKYWHGSKEQYDALSSYDSDTLYHCERSTNDNTSIQNNYFNRTQAIYIGETMIFPYSLNGYDWYISDLFFPDGSVTGVGVRDWEVDTDLSLEDGGSWQIEFKVNCTFSQQDGGADQVICGTGLDNSILKELYLNASGHLCVNGSGIGDTQRVTNCNNVDIKLVFDATNQSLEIYKEGTLETTITGFNYSTSSKKYLGISRYSTRYRFHGTINYFKFKWLS